MSNRDFQALLHEKWASGRFVCVGLDSEYAKLPISLKMPENPSASMLAFNTAIIDATLDIACCYKPNTAFYEAHGDAGLQALQNTIAHIHQVAPDIPVILDAKRGDIGNTNIGYVEEAFDFLMADAITVHPYLGGEALQPFLMKKNKGIIILCKTSNVGSNEFQNLLCEGKPLYQIVAQHIAEKWNYNKNCAVVAGATYPEELKIIREIIGDDMPILIPGIGVQGGDLKKTISASKNRFDTGMIISASRSIIFASGDTNFAEAARRAAIKLNNEIQDCLN